MFTKSRSQKILSVIFILAILFSSVQAPSVSAQEKDGVKRQVNANSGRVSFIGPENGAVLPASTALGTSLRPQNPAMALAKRFGPEFGLSDPERELSEIKSNRPGDGRLIVRYQQEYQGVPVMAGELIVNTNDSGDLYSMNGEISPDLSLQVQPQIDSAHARDTALQALAKWYQKTPAKFVASQPELWIFDESLLQPSTRLVELVWRMEVTAVDQSLPVRELVLVNAQRGNISLHFNQIDTAWKTSNSEIEYQQDISRTSRINLAGSAQAKTYTANSTPSLPGTLLCTQTAPNCTNGSDPHADAAHKYAIGTYNFYAAKHGRDSIDNNGMLLISTVHYCDPDPFFGCPYANAFWNSIQMVYGDAFGFALADDVVAHELTHGVTEHESNLFYFYQSGAINESFSDVWGEYYDQNNSLGNDAAGVKWLIGEDVSGYGALRSMSDPPAFQNPDKMTSPYYYTADGDNGGVHYNSGVNNKAVYLMVQGGSFNGKTVTAVGWEKIGAIYYEVNTNLLASGSDYSDLYYALQQACAGLIGQLGITAGNCQQVKNALDAVEMNAQPVPDFNPDAPVCAPGQVTLPLLQDNFESGLGNWVIGGSAQWVLDTGFASSATHMMWGDDTAGSSDSRLTMKNGIHLAAGTTPYLHFKHAFLFEYDIFFGTYLDGGVLEYSVNNGATWLDAAPLYSAGKNYTGTLSDDPASSNALKGRSGFVGDSHGYVSSRYNLASLIGQTVKFRWRFATDQFQNFFGWVVDDVKLYNCISDVTAPVVISSVRSTASPNLLDVNFIVTFSENVTGVNASDFSLTTTGVSGAAVSGVSGSGSVYTVTVDTGTGNGTIRLNVVDNDTIKDSMGNALGGPGAGNGNFTTGEVFTINKQIETYIGGNLTGAYILGASQSTRDVYALNAGPVKVVSTNAVPFLVAERDAWLLNGVVQSFSEMMGLPGNQVTTTYYFPWYNNVTMDTQLRFANLGNTATNITVTIAGVPQPVIPLAAGASTRVSYPVNNGPVKVQSSGGVPIIVAERDAWLVNGVVQSFSEMMGLPANKVTDTYYFPWYNNVTMDTQLRFANLGNTTTDITVTIAGIAQTPITVAAGQSTRVSYAINNGPVKVTSSGGVPIIVAERDAWLINGVVRSFSEMMGLPGNQLTTTYHFPWYNNVTMDTQLRFANLGNTSTNVTVTIAGVAQPVIPLASGESTRISYPVNNGPVKITSTGGVPIIVAERDAWLLNGVVRSFSEMMGLPGNQLTTTYYFPWYNNLTMDTQLRFAVP